MDDFRRLTGGLLQPDLTPGDLWTLTHDLYDLLLDTSGIQPQEYDRNVAASTPLPFGKAIAPVEAARCLLDLNRTRAFVTSVVTAIEDCLGQQTRPVHVLYAGTGPFATLVLPAFSRFTPDQLQVTLIDLHDVSISSLDRIIERFGLGPYIREVSQTDATIYTVVPPVDVIVVECLQRGLTSEPQVAIVWNLVSQVDDDVVLIPERISLDVCAFNPADTTTDPAMRLRRLSPAPVFELSRSAVSDWGPWNAHGIPPVLPARSVWLADRLEHNERLGVAAAIDVLGGHLIGDYMSGLTHPALLDISGDVAPGTELAFEYRISPPGLVVRA